MPSEESLVIARTHCSQCLLKATTEYLCVRCESLASAIDVAKREVAEALIRAGCSICEGGFLPQRHSSGRWFHDDYGPKFDCHAQSQHELLHQLRGARSMKYRKKPVVIEAEQFTLENIRELATWCGGKAQSEEGRPPEGDSVHVHILIPTLEGDMFATLGDWIIKGVAGEFYPCKPDIFEATYEPVEEREDVD